MSEVTETINQEEVVQEPKMLSQEEVDKIIGKTRIEERKKFERKLQEVQKPVAEEVQKPRKEDFQSEDEYFDKMLDWKDQERDRKRKQEVENRDKQELSERFDTVMSKLEEIDTFDMDYFNKQLKTAGLDDYVFTRALIESDMAAELIQYLDENPDELDKLSDMKPGKRATYLGKIESKLETQAPKDPEKPKHKAVGDLKGEQTKFEELDPYKMTPEQFEIYLRNNR